VWNLVAINDVSQTKVDQDKWQYERSKDKVCHTKKTKEKNPGNFAVVRNWWCFKIISKLSTKKSIYIIVKKWNYLKKFWCYISPSECHNIRHEEWCLHQIFIKLWTVYATNNIHWEDRINCVLPQNKTKNLLSLTKTFT